MWRTVSMTRLTPKRTLNVFLNHTPTRSQLRPACSLAACATRNPAPRPSAANVAARKPISALSSQSEKGAWTTAAASCLAARSTYGARPLSFPRAGPQSYRPPLTMKDRPMRSGLARLLLEAGCTMPQIRPERGNDSSCSGRLRRFPGVGHEPMEQKMKLHRRTVLSGTAAALAAPFLTAVPARADAKRQSLVDSCLETARKVLSGKDFPDAAKLMTNARGVLIIPELVQGGFILGAEAGVTLVAVGIGVEGATTTAAGADIVAFSNSAGLFAGASIEGSYLDADNDWNALYYGPGATTKAIVLDRRFTKPGAEPIRQYLAKW